LPGTIYPSWFNKKWLAHAQRCKTSHAVCGFIQPYGT
jgi:hypothetical protein